MPSKLAEPPRVMVLAVDPGTEQSAFVVYDVFGTVARHGKHDNRDLLKHLREWASACPGAVLAVEMIASYGMPVGREVFETCVWIGRFIESWAHAGGCFTQVYRRDVKLHLCGSSRAKDGNVRAALLDKFGGKAKAVGTKKKPGPLHGVKGDVWAALGVGVTVGEGAAS